MNAKEYLNQAFRLNQLIESNIAELKALRELTVSVGGVRYKADKVQESNRAGSKVERGVVKMIELENKINREIDEYVDLKGEIRDAIHIIPNSDERLVLRYRYIEFLKWGEIVKRLRLDERRVYQLHGEALKRFALLNRSKLQ